jgi:cold-inducible RNA-binding protein
MMVVTMRASDDKERIMSSKVFVRNLPWAMTESDLSEHLGNLGLSFGSVKVISDRDTGRSRGFAFVELATEAEASMAIKMLSGYIVDGRVLYASEARQQEANKSRGMVPGRQDSRGAGRSRNSGRPKFPEKEHRFKGGRSRSAHRGESTDW